MVGLSLNKSDAYMGLSLNKSDAYMGLSLNKSDAYMGLSLCEGGVGVEDVSLSGHKSVDIHFQKLGLAALESSRRALSTYDT